MTGKRKAADAARKRRFFNYPRRGKGPIRRWLPSWRFLLGSVATLFVAGVGLFVVAYMTTDLPQADDFAQAQTTKVYYADGVTQMGEFSERNREIVDASQLPAYVRDAVVAAEDRTFWSNAGVDPVALARAFYNNLRGGMHQGGSTITQQYIERYFVGRTTTDYVGKFREAILAVKVTRESDKMEILSNYMNTIYFGRGAYGIQTAAQAYFHVDAKDLTLSQAAMLAGLIPAPSAWDPEQNLAKSKSRWEYVLDGMVNINAITEAERDQQVFPEWFPYEVSDLYAGPQGYLLQMVRQELMSKAGMTESDIDMGGLRVVTTIDKAGQDAAVAAASDLPADAPASLRVAIVGIEPTTGGIRLLYGGPDYIARQQNAATQDITQAGSTFKPITLAAALEDGIPLAETYSGASPLRIGNWQVANSGGSSYGRITLLKATQSSVNTVYAQLNEQIGGQTTLDAAIKAGIPPETIGLAPDLTNVLGTASPHPIDMARVYATFAAQGMRHDTHIVATATNPNGQQVYSGANAGVRVFAQDTMAELTYALTQVVENGTGRAARELDRPAAGKTGTSEENRSAWFVGYTPQLATAVAFYQEGPEGQAEPLTAFGQNAVINGGGPPAQMWVKVMAGALAGAPVEQFPPRPTDRPKPSNPQTSEPSPTPTEPAEPTEVPTPEPTLPPEPTVVPPTDTPTPTPPPTPTPTPTPTPPPPP
jgi:membrane peptidoglycan carboxypeptidase